jgi:hypothetical protein
MKRDDSDVAESKSKQEKLAEKRAQANLMQILRSEAKHLVMTGRLREQDAEGLVHDVALMFVGRDLDFQRRLSSRRVPGRGIRPSIRGVARKLIHQKLAEKSQLYFPSGQLPSGQGKKRLDINSYRGFDQNRYQNQPLFTVAHESEQVVVNVVFDTPEMLTPSFLSSDIVPYLNALGSLQFVLDDLRGVAHKPAVIHSIRYWNPLGLDLKGFDDVLKTLRDWIIPWRRKNAKRLAEIEAKRALAELKRAEAEAKKVRAEATKLRAEAKRTLVETESMELEVQRDRLQLDLNIISSLNSSLTEAEKMTYALRIKDGVDTLIKSRLELKTIDGKNL